MSGFFENARSPGVIGVVLGLVVLCAFGGLSMAVFDPRLNGDNVAALKDEVREQGLEIFSLEDEIERTEREIVNQKRNAEVAKKLAAAEKTFEQLAEKQEQLEKSIEAAKNDIIGFGEEQLAYREEYRVYERKRAIGEVFDEITLANGKVLKKAEIKEIQANKVRFTTEYGSSTATWDELPQSWRDRFQIGTGELEAANAKLVVAREKRVEAAAEARAERTADLRKMELQKSLRRLSQTIEAKKVELEHSRAKVAILRNKALDYRTKAIDARRRGNVSNHSDTAQKADSAAEKLDAGVRLIQDRIQTMEREKFKVEKELGRLTK